MKKLFRQLHLWLSIPLGLVITVICFSGAMLVFEKEITECVQHDIYFVEEVKNSPLPIDSLISNVAPTLNEGVSITGITVSSDPERCYKVNLSKPRRAAIYVDQYTGEVKGSSSRLPFFNTMFRLHRFLLDKRDANGGVFWGKQIVGISTLLFVVILITGIILWWPKSKKAWKNLVTIRLRSGWKRFLYDLHVVGGMYAIVFLLAMALTGLTWSYPWYRNAFYSLFGVEQTVQKNNTKGNEHNDKREKKAPDSSIDTVFVAEPQSPYLHWQDVYEYVAQENADYKQITISNGSVNVSFNRIGNQRASDSYKFDNQTGRITDHTYYSDNNKRNKLRGWIYSVHVGSCGGMVTRILAFLAALLGATLPLTGYYLWIKRLNKKNKK
ncbi:MAG: PepSY domain-containing protein [Bacteroidaceae bacterium]|nr:PepSY domain-containing protein [Bacteroidaceae bacterium]